MKKMSRKIRIGETIIVVFTFYLSILRTLLFGGLKVFRCYFNGFKSPVNGCVFGHPWMEVGCWFLIAVLTFWILKSRSLLDQYFNAWKRNWIAVAFLVWGLTSIFWSVFLAGTIYKLLIFLFSSAVAVYFAIRYSPKELIELFTRFVIACAVASLILVTVPGAGIVAEQLHYGAWRGIFNHKNFLGSFMAFGNMVFLFRMFSVSQNRRSLQTISIIFYLVTLVLVILSRSATGIILTITLHFIFLIGLIVVKMGTRLKKIHYFLGISLLAILLLLAVLNLDPLLKLIGRNASLTGRVPLWNYLISNFANHELLTGYGFGAFWSGPVQEQAKLAFGWQAVPAGDNGYLDVLLNLGMPGLFLLVGVLLSSCVNSVKYAFSRHELINYFPVAVMGYVLVANISLSFFMEFEWFVWMLVIIVLVSTQRNIYKNNDQNPPLLS